MGKWMIFDKGLEKLAYKLHLTKLTIVSKFNALKKQSYLAITVAPNRVAPYILRVSEAIERKSKKSTLLEKWFRTCKEIFIDYRQAFTDLAKDVIARPIRAIAVTAGMGLLWHFVTTNPDEKDFRSDVVKWSNEVALLPKCLRKPEAANHLDFLQYCYSKDLLRRLNLGVASVIWMDDHKSCYEGFEKQCEYLATPVEKYGRKVLDVGFLGRWWLLTSKMEDYDVNFE